MSVILPPRCAGENKWLTMIQKVAVHLRFNIGTLIYRFYVGGC